RNTARASVAISVCGGWPSVRCRATSLAVGVAEARHPECRRVSERSAKVNRSGACANRRLEGVNDVDRIVTEQLSGKRRVVRPDLPYGAGGEKIGQLTGRFLTEPHKINGLAPLGRFFGATCCHHLTDDGRQHRRCVLPADKVETLERLVDEV